MRFFRPAAVIGFFGVPAGVSSSSVDAPTTIFAGFFFFPFAFGAGFGASAGFGG